MPNPVTPTKQPRNAWAGQDKSDAEKSDISEENDAEQELPPEKRMRQFKERKKRHLIEYEVMQRWLTGDRAEDDLDAIMFQVAELALKEMLVARLDEVMKHSPTDLGFWKKGQVHDLYDVQTFHVLSLQVLLRALTGDVPQSVY